MSYTNLELVKRHICLGDVPGGRRRNYEVEFSNDEWIELPGRNIISGSCVVKIIKANEPKMDIINLDTETALSSKHLVTDSVTVSSDRSLAIVYCENIDYSVDYTEGKIIRRADGNIPEDSTLCVWYYYYDVYAEAADYSVDYQTGRIKRLTDGNIAAGQTVLVDYELSTNQLADDVISGVVAEANTMVEHFVDTEGSFGADLALQTAASYLAVSLICRIAAVSDLRQGFNDGKSAQSWIALAENYRRDYDTLIKSFRPGVSRVSRPTHS